MLEWINAKECPPVPYKDVLFIFTFRGHRFPAIGHYATHSNAYMSASIMGQVEVNDVTHWALIELPAQPGD